LFYKYRYIFLITKTFLKNQGPTLVNFKVTDTFGP
jgi:hypothetical protein